MTYRMQGQIDTAEKAFVTADKTNSYIVVRSASGDPIQLADFRPVACNSLARVGNANDGGYVVPLDAIRAAGALVSLGLSHNWTFEHDFKKQNSAAAIHCYDHTVSFLTAFNTRSASCCASSCSARSSPCGGLSGGSITCCFSGRKQSTSNKGFGATDQFNSATIEDVFSRLPAGCQVFVKMDIEGGEYRVLDDLLRHSGNIVAMAIEFHDVDIIPQMFNSFVAKIKRDFHIVHIHGNNLGGVAPFNFPIAPEITFLNKRFFNSAPPPSGLSYPVPGLDQPNYPQFPDFVFEFSLEHDPEKWVPVFPRDKRGAFARRSCSNKKIEQMTIQRKGISLQPSQPR